MPKADEGADPVMPEISLQSFQDEEEHSSRIPHGFREYLELVD